MGRYIRYWYTYRTAVAVIIAIALSGAIYFLYTQQVTCDTHVGACLINISVHPEDRFVPGTNPDPNVIIVGIDAVGAFDHPEPMPEGVIGISNETACRGLDRLCE